MRCGAGNRELRVRTLKRSSAPQAPDRGPAGRRLVRGVEWTRQQVAIVAGVATVAAMLVSSPAMADTLVSAQSAAPAASGPTVRVVVTPASRPDPYDASKVFDPVADQANADTRAAKTQSVHGRAALNGGVNSDLPAVSGVAVDVTPDQLAALRAQPDLVVTPDVNVSVADASFTAVRAPAAVFPQTTGASQLWANGIDGSGVTVAVLDTGIARMPDFGKRL